jgi:hypothetical protein
MREIIEQLATLISIQIGRQCAHKLGYQNQRAFKKPFVNNKQTACLCNWTIDNWCLVLWTNKLSFELGKNSKAILVWRQMDKKYWPAYLKPNFQSRWLPTMIWGGFFNRTKAPVPH